MSSAPGPHGAHRFSSPYPQETHTLPALPLAFRQVHLDFHTSEKIPHVGSGRRRRFKPEAVPVFQKLRSESRSGRRPGVKAARRGRPVAARRGRPPGSGAGKVVVSRLTAMLKRLEKRLARVEGALNFLWLAGVVAVVFLAGTLGFVSAGARAAAQIAGLAAFTALSLKTTPRRIRNNEKLRKDFQDWIQAQGVEIAWPKLTPR